MENQREAAETKGAFRRFPFVSASPLLFSGVDPKRPVHADRILTEKQTNGKKELPVQRSIQSQHCVSEDLEATSLKRERPKRKWSPFPRVRGAACAATWRSFSWICWRTGELRRLWLQLRRLQQLWLQLWCNILDSIMLGTVFQACWRCLETMGLDSSSRRRGSALVVPAVFTRFFLLCAQTLSTTCASAWPETPHLPVPTASFSF